MKNKKSKKPLRGLASMEPARRSLIARKGGLSHTAEHMRMIGRRGGLITQARRAVNRNLDV